MYATISPVTVYPNTATQLRIGGAEISGFGQLGSMWILWTLADSTGKALRTDSLRMTGSDYAGWSGQDEDLFVWVAGQLGVLVTEIVDEVPVPQGSLEE